MDSLTALLYLSLSGFYIKFLYLSQQFVDSFYIKSTCDLGFR